MLGGRVSISAWITSFISFISLSIHPSSWKTQISPAYFSIAIASSLSTDGHSFGLFGFLFGFPLPLPLPLPFSFLALVSATALFLQVSIAAMVLSPNDEPALQIIIMCSSVKQRPFPFSFSSFPSLATFSFLSRFLGHNKSNSQREDQDKNQRSHAAVGGGRLVELTLPSL